MKLLIDMNLSPRWAGFLQTNGHEAQHWSEIGSATAPDSELAEWARARGAVVLTSDLDFGTLLAISGDAGPSVVQLRASLLTPDNLGMRVLECLARFEAQLRAGALIMLDDRRNKLRVLPIKPQA